MKHFFVCLSIVNKAKNLTTIILGRTRKIVTRACHEIAVKKLSISEHIGSTVTSIAFTIECLKRGGEDKYNLPEKI